METFSDWSNTTFAAPKAYDPAADRTLLERLGSGSGFQEAYDASRESGRAIDSWRSREVARADWFGEAADRVQAASGVRLSNPYFAPEVASSAPTGLMNSAGDPLAGRTRADLEKDFFDKVQALKAEHPDLADIDASLIDAAVTGRAQRAERASAAVAATPDANPLLGLAGNIAGGFVGKASTMDPGTLVGLALPVGGAGETVLGRVASAAITQGVGAATVSAAEQPTVQGWRADVGLSHGFDHAVGNVAEAAIGGALGGALFQGGGEAIGALGRLLAGRVAPSEVPSVVATARREGAFISDDTEAAMRAAATRDVANAEMASARPDTVPEHAAPAQIADGAAAVADPARPLPLVDRPVIAGTTDDVARTLVDASASPAEAVARLVESDADFGSRVALAAREASPELHARADALDGEIAANRMRLADLAAERSRLESAPASVGVSRVETIAGEIAAAEADLARITGKRRTSPAAVALRDEIDRLRATKEAAAGTVEEMHAAALARIDETMSVVRLALVARQSDRGRLGPEIALARATAEERLAREAPSGVSSALVSTDPTVRDLGRVATLDPEITARVASGEIDPAHAAIVAATTAAPEHQAAALAAIGEARPQTLPDARTVASDSVAAGNAHVSSAAMHGAMPFGPRIEATPEGWLAAIDQARATGTGEIVGALHRPELGDIVAPWSVPGDPKHGLSGLLERGRADLVADLPDLVASGDLRIGGSRAFITSGDRKVVVRLDWRADAGSPALDKRWILTVYEGKEARRFVGEATAPDVSSGAHSPRQPASDSVRPASPDIKDAVPLMRDDGTVELASRDALTRIADREKWMGDVISACKA